MVQHLWSLVCRDAKIDSENNLSIIDQLDSIEFSLETKDEPYVVGCPIGLNYDFQLVSVFFKQKDTPYNEITVEVRFFDPKGVELGKFLAEVTFEEGKNRMRSIIKFPTMPLTVTGTYIFKLTYSEKGTSKSIGEASIPIDMKLTVNNQLIEE